MAKLDSLQSLQGWSITVLVLGELKMSSGFVGEWRRLSNCRTNSIASINYYSTLYTALEKFHNTRLLLTIAMDSRWTWQPAWLLLSQRTDCLYRTDTDGRRGVIRKRPQKVVELLGPVTTPAASMNPRPV